MKEERKWRALLFIFIEGIAVYFILTYVVLGPLFKDYYTGEPAVNEVPFISSYISLGMAVAYVTITMTVYPVIKYREGGDLNG